MSLLTLEQVLALDAVREGAPELIVPPRGEGRIRWCHVAEVLDVAPMLSGGEMVLTTGVLLADPALHEPYIEGLAKAGVTAVFLGIGRAFSEVPPTMTRAARQYGVGLVALWLPVAFVRITEAVQLATTETRSGQLALADRLHRRLDELTIEGAPIKDLVEEISRDADCPVVVENVSREVIHAAGGRGLQEVLRDWSRISGYLGAINPEAPVAATPEGLVAAPLGRPGQTWGRIVLAAHALDPDQARLITEIGASALTVHLMATRGAVSDAEAQHSLFHDLVAHRQSTERLALRCRAAGFQLDRSVLVPLVVREQRTAPDTSYDIAAQLRARAHIPATRLGLSVLVGPASDSGVPLLLAVPDTMDPVKATTSFAEQLVRAVGRDLTPLGAGTPVRGLSQLANSLAEADQALRAAGYSDPSRPVVRLTDFGLAGLVHQLRDSQPLQDFVDRQLGPLADEPELIEVLDTYIRLGLNKSLAADALHLSRPAVYRRLTRIAERLGADLDDLPTMSAVYVALLGRRVRGR